VRGVFAPLSVTRGSSIQSDTKTCRTPKAARNPAEILVTIRVHGCDSRAQLRLRRSRSG